MHSQGIHFVLLYLPWCNTFTPVWGCDSQILRYPCSKTFSCKVVYIACIKKRQSSKEWCLWLLCYHALSYSPITLWKKMKKKKSKKQWIDKRQSRADEIGSFTPTYLTDLVLGHFVLLVERKLWVDGNSWRVRIILQSWALDFLKELTIFSNPSCQTFKEWQKKLLHVLKQSVNKYSDCITELNISDLIFKYPSNKYAFDYH